MINIILLVQWLVLKVLIKLPFYLFWTYYISCVLRLMKLLIIYQKKKKIKATPPKRPRSMEDEQVDTSVGDPDKRMTTKL